MVWELIEPNLDAVRDELLLDGELYARASTLGIESAGELLAERADPDVRDLTLPPYWYYLKREIFELLCKKAKKYDSVRADIAKVQQTGRTWFVPMLAAAIGSHINVEAAILMPFVALGLLGAGRVGVQAWCNQTQYEFGTKNEPLLLEPPKKQDPDH